MNNKKNALGRGLGALIPEMEDEENQTDGIKEIDINEIAPAADQPRKNFDEEKIQKLAESIKEHGVLQPILVKKDGKYYKIIAGERRWRAARIAGLKNVPIIEKKLTDREAMEISLIENLQREDLNPIEEAQAYKKLMDDFKLTQEDIAKRVGKSRPAITNSIRLLSLDERVSNYLIDGTISEGHGKVLASINDKNLQFEIAKKIIDENLNVRQTEKLIKKIEGKKEDKEKVIKKEVYIKDIENRMGNYFGTKVTINKGRKKGKIEIEYYSKDDLERIVEMLNL